MTNTLNSVDELLKHALLMHQQGQLSNAKIVYEKILQTQPLHFDALHYLGVIAYQTGHLHTAVELMSKALKIKQTNPSIYSNYGNVLVELEQYEAALTSYDNAIALKSDYAEAFSNRGNVFRKLKQYEAALDNYDKAISLKPDYAEAYSNRGNVLRELKHFEAALANYDKTIALKPDYAVAYSNKGEVYSELKQLEAALANYDKAIALKPDFAEAYCNRGIALGEQKQYKAVLADYLKALALNPDHKFLRGAYLQTKMHICDWDNFSEGINQLTSQIKQYKKASAPFELLSLTDSLPLQKQAAEIYTQSNYHVSHKLLNIPKYPKHQRIRIGYFSADFKEHPVGYLTAELYELHNRDRFEVIGFSFGPANNSLIRKRLERSFADFIDVSNLSDEEVASLSRKMEIDIAIDLGGFTKDARTGIFAMQAAPIQVNYLGYPGTMGATFIDYIIADKIVIPPKSEMYYSEKVVYLPNTFWVNDTQLQISDKVFSREELGIPEHAFVFCCFNNNYKINPIIFDCWVRILNRVEGSVLWLFAGNPTAASNLLKEAKSRGLVDRLIFSKSVELRSEHLAKYRYADLFLDTLPFNALTTASDALWAGLPVLTCIGDSFVSRGAASLLNAIHLPELITHSQDDYEALAVKLATHPDLLKAIKLKLQINRLTTPLFNTQLFTQHIENAYIQMYERYQADLPPAPIYVNDTLPITDSTQHPIKILLHIESSHNCIDKSIKGFNDSEWKELRLDIDASVNPDSVGTMTAMSGVKNSSINAIFSNHTIQHLYPHEVPVALNEFYRVLKIDGFCVITCPDLKSVCEWVALDKLTEPALVSSVGPITPLDFLYGYRDFLAKGNLFMAHRCGFTEKVLRATLNGSGFQSIVSLTRPQAFDCWALACKNKKSDHELRALAQKYFPF